MSMREMFETAATAVGAKPPRLGVPLVMLRAAGHAVSVVGGLLRRDLPLNATGVRLLYMTSPADHSKAMRELGWKPRPAAESIRRAAQFYVDQAKRSPAPAD
jgi:nucleoside-diphosphate-sugar epimerase